MERNDFFPRYLILVLLLVAAYLGVAAQETFVEGDFTYMVKPRGLVALSYAGTCDIIEMPSVVSHNGTDYTVVEIGNKLFFKDENVVSINFPATAETIGDSVCDHERRCCFRAIRHREIWQRHY